MKEGFEGAITENNIEVAVIGPDQVFRILTPTEVKEYLQEVN
jgi:20S proteasome subunit alpha 2